MHGDQLNTGSLEHLGVGHSLVDVFEDPDLAGDGNVAGFVSQADHLRKQLPLVL